VKQRNTMKLRFITLNSSFAAKGAIRSLCMTLALLGTSAQAEGPGWSPNSTVKKIVVTYDGGVNVLFSPQPTACVSNSGYGTGFASVYPTHPGINRIKAVLMTAYLNGNTVAVYYDNNTCRIHEVILGGW
jgi:hypothetical protein